MHDTNGSARKRVLAVDDSAEMLLLVSTSLEARGYEVDAVDSGFAALEACRESSYDAVVLDVNMPGIDGLEVGRALRAAQTDTDAPAIAMHTSLDERVVRAAFADYDDFLPKPCEPRVLVERVDRMIAARAERR